MIIGLLYWHHSICVRVEVGIIVLCTVGVLWRIFLKMQNEEKVLIGVLMCVYAKSWWWSQGVLLLVAKKAFSAVHLQRYRYVYSLLSLVPIWLDVI